jgi:hypothetical protein
MQKQDKKLITNIAVLATMDDAFSEIENAAICISKNRIEWIGKCEEIPSMSIMMVLK